VSETRFVFSGILEQQLAFQANDLVNPLYYIKSQNFGTVNNHKNKILWSLNHDLASLHSLLEHPRQTCPRRGLNPRPPSPQASTLAKSYSNSKIHSDFVQYLTGGFFVFFMTLFNTASSAATQIPLCRRMYLKIPRFYMLTHGMAYPLPPPPL
jgi:hypothetical protein